MTVKEIVVEYLKSRGFDGLCDGVEDGCGCLLPDLMPCGGDGSQCTPGYNNPEQAKKEGATCWIQETKP